MALERITPDISRFTAQEKNRFVSNDDQLFALQLSQQLADPQHKEVYLHLAKYTQRALLEEASRFVTDANADNKAKLFMWKVKQLRQEWQAAGKNPQRAVIKITRHPTRSPQPSLFS